MIDSSASAQHGSNIPGIDQRAFACPFEPFPEALPGLIAVEYARGISSLFLDKHRDRLASSASGVSEVITPWLAGADVHGAGWDLCFGDVYRALHIDVDEPEIIAASIAMHLGARGLPSAWRSQFTAPLRLRWGNLLLPPMTKLEVECDGDSASLSIGCDDKGSELSVRRGENDCWTGDAEVIPRVTQCGMQMNVLHRGALVVRDFDDLVVKALPTIDARMVAVLNQAVQLIDTYTPVYIPWIRRALHNIFILYPRSDTIESGSVEHYLGLIHISAHAVPLPIAELLVHEAAHQHMNLLTKLGPVDDGSDPNMYYSPPVDKCRKVSLIIAAYHAFANVLLFYRLCRKNGIAEVRECDRQEGILLPWLEQLETPLVDNPALTDIGRALWEPLKLQLRATA